MKVTIDGMDSFACFSLMVSKIRLHFDCFTITISLEEGQLHLFKNTQLLVSIELFLKIEIIKRPAIS
jgi:hypothetical protein